MAIEVSSIAIEVKSQGIAQAAQDMKALAEAARNVDKETRTLLLTTAKAAAKRLVDEDARNKLIQQKQDIWNYNQSVKEYVAAHTEALKINRALKAEEDRRNIIQQKRDYESYTQSVKEQTSALQEEARAAAALEKAHGMALEMNKRFDRKAMIEQQRGVSQSAREQSKAHDEATAALGRLNNSGSIFNNTLKSMAVAASAYLGVNFAKGIVEAGDAWGTMQAKLQLSTGSAEAAKKTQMELYDLAQKIRIPLADSAQLYNRMSIPMQKLGKSSQETMGMVESMGLALKLSGATAQEASSVMLQFSQSMNAGRLNGGEFNAVAEGAPIILRAIEEELRRTGKWGENTTETLKKMGSEGKISSELLASALNNALPKFRQDFESLPLTVDGAMQRVKNSWLVAIGTMSQNTKLNEELARTIGSLERMLPAVAEGLIRAFVAIHDNIKPIAVVIGAMIASNFVTWLASAATAAMTFSTAIGTIATTSGIAATALQLIPFVPVLTAVTALAGGIGYMGAKLLFSEDGSKKAATATTVFKSSVEEAIEQVGRENDELDRQYKLLKGIASEKSKAGSSGGQDLLRETSLQLEQNQKIADRFREKGKIALAESIDKQNEELKQKIQSLKLDLEVKELAGEINKKILDRQETAKYTAELNKKLRFDTKSLMEEEIRNIDKSKLSSEDYVKVVAKIKEGYASTTSIRRVSLNLAEKEAAALEEVLAKQRELLGIEGDGKRTSAEKKLTQLEAQKTKLEQMTAAQAAKDNIDKKAAITDIDAAIALAKRRAGIESQIVSIEEQKKAEAEFTNGLKEKLKTLEKEAESYDRKAQSIGLEKDAVAKLAAQQEAETLKSMQRQQAKQTDIDLQTKIADAANRVYEAEKKIADQRRAEKVAELMQKVNIDPTSIDEAKKAKLRLQAAEDVKLVNSVDITQDPVITTEQAKADARLAIARKLKEDLDAIDAARVQVQLTSAESIAGSLASIAANTAGKQSGIYKAMFAVQKGFAIAKAMMDIQMAVSSASWSLPFPANLGAMATVAASGASIISNIMSLGYEKGGYTGNYGTSEVAGVVHGQEFVVNASGTARHRALLEAINRGQDPAMIDNIINMPPPSVVSNSNGGMNVTVENHGTSIETQQITPNEIRIIARREARDAVRRDAGNVVSAAIAQPNSNVSKALGRNTQTQRRRN